jgi:predicted dehydrogenase
MLNPSNEWLHALIGCGRVAPTHVDAAGYAAPLRLAYAVDTDTEIASAFAARWGLAPAELDQVMADAAVRSVSICTPHDTHPDLALQALSAGKHVLLEKPPTLDPSGVLALAAAARSADRLVFPITQHRFDPLVGLVRNLIAEGHLGALRMARVSLECVRDPAYYGASDWRGTWAREGGSVLMNQGYHFIDMLMWLAGPVVRVEAMMDTLGNREVMETEDSLVAALQLENGALGTVAITGAAGSAWSNVIELMGDRGIVAFDLSTPARLHRLELTSKKALKHWRSAFAEAQKTNEIPLGVSYYGVSHRDQFRALTAAVEGTPDPRAATLEQAAETVRVIQAIYASARGGRTSTSRSPLAARA